MRGIFSARVLVLMLVSGVANPVLSQEVLIGGTVKSLLDFAKGNNPEYASMQFEADAAGERITPAGALPDPKLRMELQDITKMGTQSLTLNPSRVGSTKYTLMQELPWYGKRDLKREIAKLEAEGAQGRARGSWSEIASRIKTAHAQLYILHRNEQLTREILDLMARLEKVAQQRYAGGLAIQQDVIRAQVEQTGMRNDLIMLENDGNMLRARLNALLARPINAPLAAPEVLRPIPTPAKLDYATLEDRVRGHNPQLFTEEARIKSAEKNRELTYKNRYPDFALAISPIQTQSSIKQWEAMLEFNIPLQQSSRRAMEHESELMLSAARSRKQAASNQILGELAENLAGIEAARRIEMRTINSLLPQAELTFTSALASYENGKVDFSTLLEAQQQIRKARQNQIRAQAEAQMRLAEIEKLLGEDL
nr:TolC family protein [Undibacterium sp.]